MANRSVSGTTNLLQRLAVALSDGGADAVVDYVPVSRTPYVRVAHGDAFDPAEDLRNRILLALVEKGFRRRPDGGLAQDTGRGIVHVDVEGPTYDPVRRRAVLDLSASGPYAVPQRVGARARDPAAERRRFQAAVARAEDERFQRAQGAGSILRVLLRSAPFEIPHEDLSRIAVAPEPAVGLRVARAFATQRLASLDDLVEAAGLGELLGRTPAAPAPAA